MDIALWICILGAVSSFLYFLYAMFIKKKPGDVSLDSALRSMSEQRRRGVKESSRILQPDPSMKKATDAEEDIAGVSEPESEIKAPDEETPYEAPEEAEYDEPEEAPYEEPEPAEEEAVVEQEVVQPEQKEDFFEGLDEDIQSDYHERQTLESEAETPEPSKPIEDSSEDEVFNVASEFQEAMPSDADFYGSGGAPQMPVIESDDVLESQEPGEEPEYEEISDTTNPEGTEGDSEVETSDFDFFNSLEKKEQEEEETPGPAEISAAFDNLAYQASEGEQEKKESEESEGEEEEEEEQEGDDTLFK
ncbi:hypothetical protein ACFL6F_00140 [Planctomycetota bacterium]